MLRSKTMSFCNAGVMYEVCAVALIAILSHIMLEDLMSTSEQIRVRSTVEH